MRCPRCRNPETRVVDSRPTEEARAIRRRRECPQCSHRFTTYERVDEHRVIVVIKKDGKREVFDREKLLKGFLKACEKRPVTLEMVQEMTSKVQEELETQGIWEIPSSLIGEMAMRQLQRVDKVAYVRFASVYREFTDVTHFMEEVQKLLEDRAGAQQGNNSK